MNEKEVVVELVATKILLVRGKRVILDYDLAKRVEEENPAIGIIICKSKSRTVVEYALRDVHKPIGVSTYSIKKLLPKAFKKYLPSSKELAASVMVVKGGKR